jgi:hypothetical protein
MFSAKVIAKPCAFVHQHLQVNVINASPVLDKLKAPWKEFWLKYIALQYDVRCHASPLLRFTVSDQSGLASSFVFGLMSKSPQRSTGVVNPVP